MQRLPPPFDGVALLAHRQQHDGRPQMTVTGMLWMKATGEVTVKYNGANGTWMLIPAGADKSHVEFLTD